MTRRVVITGMGGVTAFGESWQSVSSRLLAYENAVRKMPEWQVYDGLHTLLGAPIDDFTLPEHYTRKRIRAMGRVSLMSTRATELALEQAKRCSPTVKPVSPTVLRQAAPVRSANSRPCSPKSTPITSPGQPTSR